jgi:C-terminal processing protease CtpA/Prc
VNDGAAQLFAQQLSEVIELISEKYVQPVSRADLAVAAVRGLYEAAGVPLPPRLPAEVRKAAGTIYDLHQILVRVRTEVSKPDHLGDPRAIRVSMQGMMRVLDPYCAVLTAEQAARTRGMSRTQGIGLELAENTTPGPLVIQTVHPGGPAQRAGLRPGDQITHVDGRPITNEVYGPTSLQFQSGQVKVRVVRPRQKGLGATPLRSPDVILRAEAYRPETVLGVSRSPEDNSWDYFLDREHGIAQVRLAGLDLDTPKELVDVLDRLVKANLRGLILDLRWCPGGFLEPSRDVADVFLGDCNLGHLVHPAPGNLVAMADLFLANHYGNATVEYRGGKVDTHPRRTPGRFVGFPIVVLVNAETSGGAELVAAVLQDNYRARIAGQRTRGKGTVQSMLDLSHSRPGLGPGETLGLQRPIPDTILKLSEGVLVRPSRKNMNRFSSSRLTDDWGVRPDPGLEFRMSPSLSNQLKEWWIWQTLRPGSSDVALPLDDPEVDPLRQAMLRRLRDLVK